MAVLLVKDESTKLVAEEFVDRLIHDGWVVYQEERKLNPDANSKAKTKKAKDSETEGE